MTLPLFLCLPLWASCPREKSKILFVPGFCRKSHTFRGETLSQGCFEVLPVYAPAARQSRSQMDKCCLLSSFVSIASPGRTDRGRHVTWFHTYLALRHRQEMRKKNPTEDFEWRNHKPRPSLQSTEKEHQTWTLCSLMPGTLRWSGYVKLIPTSSPSLWSMRGGQKGPGLILSL